MPAETPWHKFPYPVGADPINVAADFQALAEELEIQNFVRIYGTRADLLASGLPENGRVATIYNELGWGTVTYEGSAGWYGDRVVSTTTTTDSIGMFTIAAAAVGFTQILHADIMCAIGIPGGGAVNNACWYRLGGPGLEVQVVDYPSGIAAANRSVPYTARIRGKL